jgi:dihydroorotate dehydrogenase
MFRLKQDQAVINRYGFNSEGHNAAAERLKSRIRSYLHHNKLIHTISNTTPTADAQNQVPLALTLPETVNKSLVSGKMLGVNLGKNKTSTAESNDDYINGVIKLGPFADYVVINISSPNTPGLRALQRREPMLKLLNEVKKARDEELPHQPPLLVKIAPDVSDLELEDIAAVVKQSGIDGVIIGNTTISRPESLKSGMCTPLFAFITISQKKNLLISITTF